MVSSLSGASLISYYQGQAALSLFGSSSGTSSAGASNSALLSSMLSKEGITSSGSNSASAATAPTAPWASSGGTPTVQAAVQNAINGQQIVNPNAAQLNAPGGVSTSDYKNLFGLYQGLNTLYDLASTAAAAGTSSASSSLAYLQPSQLQAAFASGMSQVQSFVASSPFTGFNLTAGAVNTTETSSVGIPNGTYQSYTTGVIGEGDESTPLAAFQGDVQFNISVANEYANTTITNPDGTTTTITQPPVNVPIDLSNMGSTPRTIDNVVNYLNKQMTAAGLSTQFAAANLGSTATTTTLPNGQTSTSTGTTEWGLKIQGTAAETVTFSAPSTAAAVYVSMGTGGASTYTTSSSSASSSSTGPTAPTLTTTPTGVQMMKLQTNNDVTGTAPPTVSNAGTNSNLPVGAVFANNLPSGVSTIEASTTGSDGSVYLLADATGAVNGSPVPGGQGVALLKYDASGKLLYSKVVGGLQSATGASIAVNTDGSVAVAGTNTTSPSTASDGLTTPGTTSAFVQVYDPTGAPTWGQTIPTVAGASVASGVAFASDGSVYVSGSTNGSIGNQINNGTTDEFIQGFSSAGTSTFTTQFGAKGGTNTSGGLVYDASNNSLYTVGSENSQAVVRSFALSSTGSISTIDPSLSTYDATATATGSRNLGNVLGVAGIGLSNGQIVVGGTVGAATIHAGTVTTPYVGVSDGFVASISSSLTTAPTDSVAYLGLSGATQTATAFSVAGGQAYLAGTIANDPSSLAANGATEGFVTGVDPSSGSISYSTKLAGANGQAAPTSITVSTAGSSILDQLGLPQGTVNLPSSDLITAATSIKAGQSFWVRTSPGGPQTQVTISATDTLASLATKLNAAIAGQGTATVQAIGANSELEIQPLTTSSFIELDAQSSSAGGAFSSSASSSSSNVLASLGLQAGVIRTVRQVNGLTDVTQTREYGMDLPSNLSISTAASAQHAANAIQAAMSAVQHAYQDLATPPTMAAEAAAAAQNQTGSVPPYLTSEISNLKAGLARLTGGQTTTSTSGASSSITSLFNTNTSSSSGSSSITSLLA